MKPETTVTTIELCSGFTLIETPLNSSGIAVPLEEPCDDSLSTDVPCTYKLQFIQYTHVNGIPQ